MLQTDIRGILRGKAEKKVAFGLKIAVSKVKGYISIDKASFPNFNESQTLIEIVCKYKEKHGVYPEVIRADKIDQTRNNKFYCASLFIRLSGLRLGRKPKDNPMQYIHFMLYNLSLRKITKGTRHTNDNSHCVAS